MYPLVTAEVSLGVQVLVGNHCFSGCVRVCVCVCVYEAVPALYSVVLLCICVYASTSVSAGVCELATNKVTGYVLCDTPGAIGLAQHAQTEHTSPQTIHYYALLCTCVMFSC